MNLSFCSFNCLSLKNSLFAIRELCNTHDFVLLHVVLHKKFFMLLLHPEFLYFLVFKDAMINGGTPSCVGVVSPSGWVTAVVFVQWMKHFIQ